MPDKYNYPLQDADHENIALILPVYNSEKHLNSLISQLLEHFPANQIIAVDDGSSDNSAQICRNKEITLIEFEQNRGKGAALLAGMKKAWQAGYKFTITIDSDEQHKPCHLPEFIIRQQQTKAAMVLGKRDFNSRIMPLPRIWSNKLTSFMVSITVRQKVADSQCGYRLYYLKPVMDMKLVSSRYQFETEILLKMAKAKYLLADTDIDTVYGEETSHINHLRDIKNFINILISHWLHK